MSTIADAILKPCPFCGHKPRLVEIYDHYKGIYLYSVQCDNSQCLMAPGTIRASEKDEVITYWNTRYTDA